MGKGEQLTAFVTSRRGRGRRGRDSNYTPDEVSFSASLPLPAFSSPSPRLYFSLSLPQSQTNDSLLPSWRNNQFPSCKKGAGPDPESVLIKQT